MTGQISLRVWVPAVRRTHDFLVPPAMSASKAAVLMIAALSEEYGVSKSSRGAALFDRSDGTMLRGDCSLTQMGISNGAELILF